MKVVKVTVTKTYLDQIKADRDRYSSELEKVKADRAKFRIFFLTLMKDNIAMAGKNQYYSAETMLAKLGKLMNQVENWWWETTA